MDTQKIYTERIYKYPDVCVFRKTKEIFGGLSNMASGFPIKVNGHKILTSEALYQACRFPHLPDVQRKIIAEKSPMTAKMVSKPFRAKSRPDWDKVRTDIMYWCLRVKLAQNFMSFGQLLESTFDKPIVEDSSKDAFWGAIHDKKEENILIGVNALGRLLMKLRQEYNSNKRFDLLLVEPLSIPHFFIFNEAIQVVDERQLFISNLSRYWEINLHLENSNPAERNSFFHNSHYSELDGNSAPIVEESETKKNKSKKNNPKIKTKKEKLNQGELGLS